MYDGTSYRKLVRERIIHSGHYRRCSCCGLWVHVRNHRRHQRACARAEREAKEKALAAWKADRIAEASRIDVSDGKK